MKIARFFAYVFACIGVLLLIGSMSFLLWNRKGQVMLAQLPQEAIACGDAFVRALNDGDLEAAAEKMYGQPDLGIRSAPENPESAQLWEAFLSSLEVELTGEWAVEQSASICLSHFVGFCLPCWAAPFWPLACIMCMPSPSSRSTPLSN